MSTQESSVKKQWQVPHTFVVLFVLIVLATIGTYLIPAGMYDRVTDPVTNRTVVDPATYHSVPQSPVGVFSMFIAVYKGLVDAGNIIFFIMISYGCFFLIIKSGALNAGIGALLRKTKGYDKYVLVLFTYLFATASAFFGMFEEAFGFLPVFVGLAIAMGYDAIVGMSVIALGCGLGFSAAFMNPFTVGLAQKLSDLPLFSGLTFRIISWLCFVTIGVIWMLRYADKVKKDPSKSLMAGVDMGALSLEHDDLINVRFSGRNRSVLLVLLIGMAVLIWGVLTRGWYFDELCGILLITGIAAGLVNGWGPSAIADIYIEAWKDIIFGATVCGVSRGVLIVLQQGQIIDSIIRGLAAPLASWPRWLAAEGMLFVQTLISFLIPSGTGMAVTTMPIMAPLSDILGISRQIAVLVYQYADGFSNIFFPTTLMPVICACSKVPVDRWLKYFTPLFLFLYLVQMVFVYIALVINYQ